MNMPKERLQKILSRAGISSRRKAEEFILSGKIKVNGKVIRELGAKADPASDNILVNGRPLKQKKKFNYYAYYKPQGVVVSKKDELGRKGIFDLLKLPLAVNAVGRLDKDSEGLLLLSDDGEFVHRYTHPSFEISKIYHVQVSRELGSEEIKKLKTGIIVENKTVRANAVKNFKKGREEWLEIELREGIKREIRRMLEKFGVKVLRLIRIQHGTVKLGRLKAGELKILRRGILLNP